MLPGTFKIVQNRMACADIYEIVSLKLRGFFGWNFATPTNQFMYRISHVSC